MKKFIASLLAGTGLIIFVTAPAFAQASQAAWRFEEIVALDHATKAASSLDVAEAIADCDSMCPQPCGCPPWPQSSN